MSADAIYETRLKQLVDERDAWVRHFNRLDAAINHHLRDSEGEFATDADDRLWAARDRIVSGAGPTPESALGPIAKLFGGSE